MTKQTARRDKIWLWVGALVAGIAVIWIVLSRRRPRAKHPGMADYGNLQFPYTLPNLPGLSEEEAARRMPAFDRQQLAQEEEKQFRRAAIRLNLLSTFNIDIFAIALVMLILGSPASALSTMLILFLNVTINVLQVMLTRKRLNQILETLRPQATVLRGGRLRSIDPVQVVEGDLLVLASGDRILVDGELIGDESVTVEEAQVSQTANPRTVNPGGALSRGSNCVAGHGLYRAAEAGYKHYRSTPASHLQLLQEERTPLEKIMEAVLRGLLVIVIVFSIFLLTDNYLTSVELLPAVYREAFSIVLGIAPTSLFFVLIMQYAMGTMRMSDLGALVYKSQSIEALSSVSVICMSDTSLMRGIEAKVEPVSPPPGYAGLSENAIRVFIGDTLHSLSSVTQLDWALLEAFPGTPRQPLESALYFKEYGWLGISFDDPDRRGTFVIGLPEALKANLVRGEPQIVQEVSQKISTTGRGVRYWASRFFRRTGTPASTESEAETELPAPPPAEAEAGELPEPIQLIPNDFYQLPAWQQKFISGLQRLLTPMEERQAGSTPQAGAPGKTSLLCAYWPEPLPLHGWGGRSSLPAVLIPLAYLDISGAVRPESRQVLEKFVAAGLQVKIFSTQPVEYILWLMKSLGWETDHLETISGAELEQLGPYAYDQRVQETVLFGELSPAQKTSLVQALQRQGEFVAMLGDQVNDIPAMQQANLCLALRSSAQASLALTDIVLIQDSLDALPSILTTGQRMVNSVLDTFKLYLSQVTSQLILVAAVLVFGLKCFPYNSTQGGIVSAFTIALPNIILSAWSAAGKLDGPEMRRRLARFVLPSSVTLAVLVFAVFQVFWALNPPAVFPAQLLEDLQVTDTRLFYAQMAVTFALLFAGWLRLLFLQPPTPFWTGGAPLRGDRRVYWVVSGTAGLLALLILFPFLPTDEWLRLTWLPRLVDYLLVGGLVILWAFVLRLIWRVGWRRR